MAPVLSARQARQKDREKFHAEEFARLSGIEWIVHIQPNERVGADLLVDEAGTRFALEHTVVHVDGVTSRSGSRAKAIESTREKRLRGIQQHCQQQIGVPITVIVSSERTHYPAERFHFDALADEAIEQEILSCPLRSATVGERFQRTVDKRTTLFVRLSPRPIIQFIQHSVGSVSRNPAPVQAAIAEKSKSLPKYALGGVPDVRLLVVADRLFNSGKIDLLPDTALDTLGFQRIYFLSYPITALQF